MLKRSKDLDDIVMMLSLLQYYVQSRSKAGYTDVNRDCEDLFCEIFNLLMGFKLKNLNGKKNNHPAIDLGDTQNKTAFQITSRNDRKKILETIDKFNKHELKEKYKNLYIFIIGNKLKYKNIEAPHKTNLSILSIDDLINYISIMEQERLSEMAKLLKSQINDQFLQHQAETKEYYSIKTEPITYFKNGKTFMKEIFKGDLDDSIVEYNNILEDIRSFIRTLNLLSRETRKLYFNLTKISDMNHKKEIVTFDYDYAKSRICSVGDIDKDLKILFSKDLIRECTIYKGEYEFEAYELFFKNKNDWSLVYSLLSFVTNEEEQKEMFVDMDFSVLD